MTAAPIIDVRGLWTQRGEQTIHRGVDLAVEKGDIVGLVGGSGSGKTLLLRAVVGLDRPSRGEVTLFGVDSFPAEGLFSHNSRTAVIDRRGTLVANIEGNQYTAAQLGDLVQSVLDQ